MHITADTQIVVRMSADTAHESLCMKLLMLRNHDSESICGFDRKADEVEAVSQSLVRLSPECSVDVSQLQLSSASTLASTLGLQGLYYL